MEILNIRIESDLLNQIKEIASSQETTTSQLIRKIIKDNLINYRKENQMTSEIQKEKNIISLTDDSGKWFDESKAITYKENTYWNGNNHISKITDQQWHHVNLIKTATGKWILNNWSNFQGSKDEYLECTEAQAAEWFTKNGEEPPEELKSYFEELEI